MTMTPDERKQARKETKRRNYLRHREAKLAYAAEYRAKNAERIKAATAGKHAEYSQRYRDRNPDKCREMAQAWKDANPERRKETQAAYLQNNLDRHRVHQHNRRAKATGGKLSPDLAQRLYVIQKGKCACCKSPLGDDYDMDHIEPLALGGPNTNDNIQLLTSLCNRQKGAKPSVEFMRTRGLLL